MIVEEKRASDYECPQAKAVGNYVYCRGSRCMAWRWADNIVKHIKLELVDEKSTTHGYCGLAGKP